MSDQLFKTGTTIILLLVMAIQAYLFFDFRSNRVPNNIETTKNEGIVVTDSENKLERPSPVANIPPRPSNNNQLTITAVSDPKTAALMQKVFKHIYLPGGNVRIETIINDNDLRKTNPIFYEFAKVGDKLLIYSDRIILYDPTADKVIDVLHTK